jgi:hypothetical protein
MRELRGESDHRRGEAADARRLRVEHRRDGAPQKLAISDSPLPRRHRNGWIFFSLLLPLSLVATGEIPDGKATETPE